MKAKHLYWVFGLILMVAALYHQWSKPFELYPYDDALMYYRYAHNIVANGVFGWNLEPSNGCTSTLYTLITSGSYYFLESFDISHTPETLMMLQSVFFYIAFIVLVIWVVKKHKPDLLYKIWFLPLLCLPLMLRNAFNGMETSLAILLLALHLLFLYRIKEEIKDSKIGLSNSIVLSLLIYLNYSVRPESLLFHFVIYSILLIMALKSKGDWKWLFNLGLITSVFIIADSLIRYSYFGYVFALPVYVKTSGFYEGDKIQNLFRSSYFLFMSLVCFAPLIYISLLDNIKVKGVYTAILFSMIVVISYLATVEQMMGMAGRFYVPYLSLLIISIALFNKPLKSHSTKKTIGAFIVTALILISVKIYDYSEYITWGEYDEKISEKHYIPPKKDKHVLQEDKYILIAKELAKIDDKYIIASGEHGAIAAYNKNKTIIDIIGLHNESIAFGEDILETVVEADPDIIQLPYTIYLSLRKNFIDYYANNPDYYYMPDKMIMGVVIKKDIDDYENIKKAIEAIKY
jgi:hypothetical protein